MNTRALPAWLPYACVGVGAAIGTGIRAAAEHIWPGLPGSWPWTTLLINCVGALLLGWLQEWLAGGVPAQWRTLVKVGVGTGVLGGFTTYSTFVMEALQSMRAGALISALAYLAVSVVLGVVFARLGLALGGVRRPAPVPASAHATGPAGAGAASGADGAERAEHAETGHSTSGMETDGGEQR